MASSGGPTDRRPGAADLLAVVAALLVFDVFAVADSIPNRVGAALSVSFLLFVPGYAVVAALFPDDSDELDDERLGILARLVFGVGASVGVIVAVGVALEGTVAEFGLWGLLVGINAVTLAATAFAWYRRRASDQPFGVPASEVSDRLSQFVIGTGRADILLSVVMVICLFAAVAAVTTAPDEATDPAEVSLLTESDGELVADNYPEELTAGESTTLHLAISGAPTEPEATVVITLQDISITGDRVAVENSTELDRFRVTLDEETTVTEHDVVPTATGDLRLTYLVYFGSPPDQPTVASADRQVHLHVQVAEE
ncbi:MAG: putative membrane protein [Natronomonas sp.]